MVDLCFIFNAEARGPESLHVRLQAFFASTSESLIVSRWDAFGQDPLPEGKEREIGILGVR